jgi:REP element-mobilizing transposase RayT
MRRAERNECATSLAWVIMPDHFHWLLELKSGSLAQWVKQIKACSAVAINRANHSKERIWQQGFHDRALR